MLINQPGSLALSDNEFEALVEQLTDTFTAYTDPNMAPLSDYAVSREGIYADHL